MTDNLQLNITIPKQSQVAPSKNSKQKRFEKYMDRKKKKQEKKSNIHSVQHPPITKSAPFRQSFNTSSNDLDPLEQNPSQNNENFSIKPILKSSHKPFTNYSHNPTTQVTQAAEPPKPIEIEPPKPLYPSVFTSTDFLSLPINDHLKQALKASNYLQMTKIQQLSIPILLTRANSLVKSETGSGKTLCYLVPILELLMKRSEKITRATGTLALILCPIRELCIQVAEEARKLSKAAIWIVNGAIMGGESIKKEKARLRKGINILISTPGRLVYHLQNSASFLVNNLEFLVLEESDRTLDMGFSRDIELMIDLMAKRTSNWEKVQKILISANFSQKIKILSLKMTNEKEIKYIGWEQQSEEKMKEQLKSEFFHTEEMLKIPKSITQQYIVLKEDQKTAFLMNFLRRASKPPLKIMIFVATIDETEFLTYIFTSFEDIQTKYKLYKLHGDIDQKTRTSTYIDFKKKFEGFSLLITTDVASRGLDFACVDTTILTSIPNRPIDYCNTIGRTGRIDQSGNSILMLYEQEIAYLTELKQNGIEEIKRFKNFNKHEGYETARKEVVGLIRNDYQANTLAKRAYVSFMRSYNRNQKGRFNLKALNIEGLARNVGIEGGKFSQDEDYKQGIAKRKDKNRENNMFTENYHKKPVIKSVKQLEIMEFG